jgi:hypothetical protein
MDIIDAYNQAGVFAKLSLLVGFGPLGLAVAYAVRQSDRTLAIMRPASLASIFAGISGLVAGLMAVLTGIARAAPGSLPASNLHIGLAEALVPPFVNFGALAASWLLVAMAMFRRPRAD